MRGFLIACVSVVRKRFSLFVVLNWLFFGSIVTGALLGQMGHYEVYRSVFVEDVLITERSNVMLMVVSIFVSNLLLSSFLLVTLTGLAFPILPIGFLMLRGLLWGVLHNTLPTSLFLIAFPTLILEGEGYVLAGVAGVYLGLSWLNPRWAYKEENLSRADALKKALKDAMYIYVLVVVFLLAAAIVEAAIISPTISH